MKRATCLFGLVVCALLSLEAAAAGPGSNALAFTGIYSLDALINFDHLDGAVFNPRTKSLYLFGHRESSKGFVRVAYLDLLATALETRSPTFSLEWVPASEKEVDRALDSIGGAGFGNRLIGQFFAAGRLTAIGACFLRVRG